MYGFRQQWQGSAPWRWVVVCSCVLSLSGPVKGAPECFTVDIPALNAAASLRQLAQSTQLRLLFSYRLVKTRQTPAVKGCFSAEVALGLLLQGSGLAAVPSKDGAFAIIDTMQAEITPVQTQ